MTLEKRSLPWSGYVCLNSNHNVPMIYLRPCARYPYMHIMVQMPNVKRIVSTKYLLKDYEPIERCSLSKYLWYLGHHDYQ